MLARRLTAQCISKTSFERPEDVVGWLGAIQAQDFASSKWAVGLRMAKPTTDADVERAIAAGDILRTHLFRGTWQLVLPNDVHWMLELVGPRLRAAAARRHQELGLDAPTLRKCEKVLARALAGTELTRSEIGETLDRAGVEASGPRLSHLLAHAELTGLVASGAPRGKQQTHALLDARVQSRRRLPRDAALAELARRYFQSRGPATLRDFVWWSGLTTPDAKQAIAALGAELESSTIDGRMHWHGSIVARKSSAVVLLPAFDEYIVGYQNRDAIIDPGRAKHVNAGGGMLKPVVVVGGRVIGTWRRNVSRGGVSVALEPFARQSAEETRAIARAAAKYAAFLELPLQKS